jgi:hypothetical protein
MQPANFDQELEEIAGEYVGWIPLDERAYLHAGNAEARVFAVTGVPDADLAHFGCC